MHPGSSIPAARANGAVKNMLVGIYIVLGFSQLFGLNISHYLKCLARKWQPIGFQEKGYSVVCDVMFKAECLHAHLLSDA